MDDIDFSLHACDPSHLRCWRSLCPLLASLVHPTVTSQAATLGEAEYDAVIQISLAATVMLIGCTIAGRLVRRVKR